MDEPIVQPGSSASPTELGASKDSKTFTSGDFWRFFHLFRYSIVEEFIFRYWLFIVVASTLFNLLVDIIYDNHYGSSPFVAGSQTSLDLNWMVILWLMGVIGIVLTFNRWRKRIPATFRLLFNKMSNDRVSHNATINQEYLRFLEGYQQKLLSKWRYLLIGLLVFLSFGAAWLNLSTYTKFIIFHPLRAYKLDAFYTAWKAIWLIPSDIVPSLLWSYVAGAAVWAMVVTALSVKQLTTKFDIAIQPDHPDNCGGLRPLGNFCFAMALPILLGALVLGVYDVGVFFNLGYFFSPSVFTVGANVYLVGIDLPLAIIAFFVPLWNVHRKMVTSQADKENDFADKISHLEAKLRSSLDKGALVDAKAAKEEMELVRALNPDKRNYPTWPFNIRILVSFWAAVIVPFLSFVGLIVNHWDIVAKILGVFSGQH